MRFAFCSIALACCLAGAAQAQQTQTAQRQAATLASFDNPNLDIQWDAPAVQKLLLTTSGECEVSADPDAAPGSSKRYAYPSALRQIFYLANDYYGLGVEQYFTVRQDLRLRPASAAVKLRERTPAKGLPLVPPEEAQLERIDHETGVLDDLILRHTIVDPFDGAVLSDEIDRYSPMVPTQALRRDWEDAYVRNGTWPSARWYFSRMLWPAEQRQCDGTCDAPGAEDAAFFSVRNFGASLNGRGGVLPLSGETFDWAGTHSFAAAMCTAWRLEQDRWREGKETALDRQLRDMMVHVSLQFSAIEGARQQYIVRRQGK